MERNQVRYFLALCETLNFTRAAEQCNVTQPSLTRAIKNLEEEFGGPLFRRERNNTHLTELGKLIRPHLQTIDDAAETARAEAEDYRRMEKAPLRLGLMCTIGPTRLVGFLDAVRSRIPTVDLDLHDAPAVRLIEDLLSGEIDIALIGMPSFPERCDARPLFSERYMIAFPRGHRFEGYESIPLGELSGENYLQRVHCEFRYHFEALGLEKKHKVVVRYTSEREDWIQALILAGMGCAVMPEFLPMLPGLARRVIVEPEISRTIHLVTIAGRRFSPTVQAFVRLAQHYPWAQAA